MGKEKIPQLGDTVKWKHTLPRGKFLYVTGEILKIYNTTTGILKAKIKVSDKHKKYNKLHKLETSVILDKLFVIDKNKSTRDLSNVAHDLNKQLQDNVRMFYRLAQAVYGFSHQEMSIVLESNPGQLHYIKQTSKKVSLYMLCKISDAFGIAIDILIGRCNPFRGRIIDEELIKAFYEYGFLREPKSDLVKNRSIEKEIGFFQLFSLHLGSDNRRG